MKSKMGAVNIITQIKMSCDTYNIHNKNLKLKKLEL